MKNKLHLLYNNIQEKYIDIFTIEKKIFNKKIICKEIKDTIKYGEIDTNNLKAIIYVLQEEVKEREGYYDNIH